MTSLSPVKEVEWVKHGQNVVVLGRDRLEDLAAPGKFKLWKIFSVVPDSKFNHLGVLFRKKFC